MSHSLTINSTDQAEFDQTRVVMMVLVQPDVSDQI